MSTKRYKTLLEYASMNEARADDEYNKSFSSIDREIFDAICLIDPKTQRAGSQVINIGFGAKQLLLPKYMSGETDFVDKADTITSALNNYYPNIKNYPKFPEFNSVAEFITFMENPVEIISDERPAKAQEDKISAIYNKYYSDIDRETFDTIIAMDPQTDANKIGDVAKNLLLRCFRKGDTSFIKNPDVVTDAINRFVELRSTYATDKQNLMSYNTVDEFISYIPESPIVTALRGTEYAPIEGTDFIHIATTKNYDIFRPLTFRGSERIAHARGGQNVWCTAGGSDGTHFGASRDHSRDTSYWRSYSTDGVIYMFMHKTEPDNKDKNYNMSYKNGNVYEFRNGANNAPNDGWTVKDGIHKDWEIFLMANPEVAKALANCSDENLRNDIVVKLISEKSKFAEKPYVINSVTQINDLIKNRNVYKAILKEVIINGVAKIPSGLFSNFAILEKVTFEEGVEVIGMQAFKNCANLSTINQNLPQSLKVIEEEAFMSCRLLKGSIHIPDSLTDIKLRAFDGTRCKLKIDKARTAPIRFASADREWVNGHVLSIKK